MDKADLKKILINIFKKNKLSYSHSLICANALINAELVGATSHGLSRLKSYCDRIKKKVINPKPKIKINKISKSIVSIDANNAIGFVAADIGIKQAISCAKKTGIGLISIKNSGHYGLSSYYAEKAVEQNLIALCFTNAPPAIAPHGAKKSLFGTNPICFGSPTHNSTPFILDTSVSQITRGKIRVAEKLGKKIPKGVALDKFGNPTNNPKKALKGVQLPIAGYRGSGLAWMVDILSGVLTGAAHGGQVKDPFDDFSGPQNVGHLFLVFKANIFTKNFSKRIKDNIKKVKKLPKLKGVKKIVYPGENKMKRLKKNLNRKIKIPEKIKQDLNELNA